MKQRLNIKKICLFMIMFIALFAINTRVKAENCECYYTSTFLDNNIYVKVSTSNNKVNIKYYDGDVDEELNSISSDYTDQSTWAKKHNIIPNSDYIKSSEITGCPSIKVVYQDQSGTSCKDSASKDCYAFYFVGDKTIGDVYNEWSAGMATDSYTNYSVETINKSSSKYVKDKTKTCSSENKNTDTISCTGYSNADADRSIEFSYKKSAKSFSTNDFKFTGNSLDVGATISKIDFKPSDLNNKCPDKLYGGENYGSWTICLEKKDGCDKETFGTNLGKNAKSDREKIKLTKKNKNENKFTCDNLGNTLNYIKMAYNFIRFIVPVVIVILSAIDFASVVISGETDKMEKAKRKFVIRLLIGILILFIPIILEMILKIVGILDSGENLIDIACLGD